MGAKGGKPTSTFRYKRLGWTEGTCNMRLRLKVLLLVDGVPLCGAASSSVRRDLPLAWYSLVREQRAAWRQVSAGDRKTPSVFARRVSASFFFLFRIKC